MTASAPRVSGGPTRIVSILLVVAAIAGAFLAGRLSEREPADRGAAEARGGAAGPGPAAFGERGRRGPGANGGQFGPGGPGGPGGRPPSVSLAAVVKEPVVTAVEAVGAARARRSVVINAEVSGVIQRLLMKSGAEVKAGQPLVSLVDEEERIALAKARADYAIAETNARRYGELLKEDAASQLENETARNVFAAARASLDQARYDFERRTIRAPFDGVVGLTTLDAGDFLSVGATVTTIDDLSELLVDFVVPEQSAGLIAPGLEFDATLQNGAGGAVKAVVRSVDSRLDAETRTRRIEAAVANPSRALLPGATFRINITLPSREVAAVPGLAVVYDRAGAYVWRRNAEGAAERVAVAIVRRTPDAVLVDADLSAGDLVVAEGADVVRPGAPLIDRSGAARSGGLGDGQAAAMQ